MTKALFLDRDGVINRERGEYTFRIKDFYIHPWIPEILKKFQDAGFLLIVITNQSGINKRLYSHEDVAIVHAYLKKTLFHKQISLHDIFYCPHHPTKTKCYCRKPGTLLFEKAIAKYNIDPDVSLMIGDSERDIEAAQNAGISGIQIQPNENITYNSEINDILKNL